MSGCHPLRTLLVTRGSPIQLTALSCNDRYYYDSITGEPKNLTDQGECHQGVWRQPAGLGHRRMPLLPFLAGCVAVDTNNLTTLGAEANMTKIDVAKEVSSGVARAYCLAHSLVVDACLDTPGVDCSPPWGPREKDWDLHA